MRSIQSRPRVRLALYTLMAGLACMVLDPLDVISIQASGWFGLAALVVGGLTAFAYLEGSI